MKTVLVTGNLGYIGPVLTEILKKNGFKVIGFDSGLFAANFLTEYSMPNTQIIKDIRDISIEDLKGIDYVIHLAGLSNDPLGDLDERLTFEINLDATVRLAKLSKQKGIERFIYASSQSIYGYSKDNSVLDENSTANPITAYAKSKYESELQLMSICDESFICTYLRPATAYGPSPNFRYDIVLNAFVTDAFFSSDVIIKSDGSPWRPLCHVEDISYAFLACLNAPVNLINNQIFNVGTRNNNYQIKEILDLVVESLNCNVIYTNEHLDSRSYIVSSEKILNTLADYYVPSKNVKSSIIEICDFLKLSGVTYDSIKSGNSTRLASLKKKISLRELGTDLRFINK